MSEAFPGAFAFPERKDMRESDLAIVKQSRRIGRENTEYSVNSVSIDETGRIAVSTHGYVNLYAPDGSFLWGYALCTNKTVSVSLHGDSLEVYCDLFDWYFVLDEKGQVTDAKEIPKLRNSREIARIRNAGLDMASRDGFAWGECTYQINGAQVLKTAPAGNTITVYRCDGFAQEAEDFSIGAGIFLLAVSVMFVWKLVRFIQFLKKE